MAGGVDLENVISISPNSSGQIVIPADLNLTGTTPAYRLNGTNIVAGSNGQIQYNQGGRFTASSNLLWGTLFHDGCLCVGPGAGIAGFYTVLSVASNQASVNSSEANPADPTVEIRNTNASGSAAITLLGNPVTGGIAVGGSSVVPTAWQNRLVIWTGLTNALVFVTQNTQERMCITSAGRVGIGTTAPGAMLDIVSSVDPALRLMNANPATNNTSIFFRGRLANELLWYITVDPFSIGGDDFSIGAPGFGNHLFIQRTTGNVGLSATNPDTKLSIGTVGQNPSLITREGTISLLGSTSALAMGEYPSAGSYWMQVGGSNVAGPIAINPLGGNVGIGTASPAARLHIAGGGLAVGTGASIVQDGDINLSRPTPGTGAIFFGNAQNAFIWFDGTSFIFSPVSSNLPSDQRLKQNVRELTGGIAVINQIQPIEAEWNGMGHTPKGKRVVSILAQELERVLPGAVGVYRGPDSDDEEFLNYNPNEILLQAILAIQQLDIRTKELEALLRWKEKL